jgi:hypothetical protein
MPEIAYFEFTEAWGGQSAVWTRLHNPACTISADYYGVNVSGDWHTLSIEERRALASVMQSAVHFHQKRVAELEKPHRPAPGTAQIDQGG